MPSQLPDRIESALESGESQYSTTTLQSYRAAWRDFLTWWAGARNADAWELRLEEEGLPLPPFEAIAGYLQDRKDMAWSTLTGRRQAIRLVHLHYDMLDPFEQKIVRRAWVEVREQKKREEQASAEIGNGSGTGPAAVVENGLELLREQFSERRGKEDMSERERLQRDMRYLPMEVSNAEDLDPGQQKLIPEPQYDPKTMRNRALLLLVATTTATLADLVGIRVEDIHLRDKDVFLQQEAKKARNAPLQIGLRDDEDNLESTLHLRQEPQLRYCPARAVASWIVRGDLAEGALFRSLTPQGKLKDSGIQPQAINHAIRRRAEDVEGLDSDEWTTRRLRSR
ncbi:hypothetical protein [Salinibacter ruber]|uniref:hypothetical protein n=1 Tax=Salinibacter ruber TaxID=146919 RepID=UPI00216A3229|nr:hypothetical protein [Salinibacter ruber]MCS4103170.1 integrase [Salinibacter ruber]